MKKPHLLDPGLRREVIERDGGNEDGGVCRMCGRWVNTPAVHHIVYKSQGGLDVIENLITLGYVPWEHDCHLPLAHGPEAMTWRPILLELAAGDHAGTTAMQLRRWQQSA